MGPGLPKATAARLCALLALAAAAGCVSIPTSLLLRVEAAQGLPPPDELRLYVYTGSGRVVDGQRVPSCDGCTPALPGELVLYPASGELALRVLVRALAAGAVVGEGVVKVELVHAAQTTATVTLTPGKLPDRDGDGVPDAIDLCPDHPDPTQASGCAGPDGGADGGDAAPDGPAPDGPADAAGDGDGDGAPDATPDQAVTDSAADGGIVAPGTWVKIAAGTFTMGSAATETCRDPDEYEHAVTLTRDFWIMDKEVTRANFVQQLGYTPTSNTCGADCPVVQITWHEAVAYCNDLSTTNSLTPCYSCTGTGAAVTCVVDTAFPGAKIYGCPGFRLPTEAEWEYACRAGSTTPFYNGAITNCTGTDPKGDLIGWHTANAGGALHEVAQKTANAWGLYDMSGNAWEWCHDGWQASLGTAAALDPVVLPTTANAVRRGGGYDIAVRYMRSANRANQARTTGAAALGFRCVRTD